MFYAIAEIVGSVMRIVVLILVVIVHYSYLYTMEPELPVSSYTFGKTKIELKQALFNVSRLDGTVGFIGLGGDESLLPKQNNSDEYYEYCVGDIRVFHRKSVMIEVIEPLVYKNQPNGPYVYFVEKHCAKKQGFTSGMRWDGDKALEKASEDLAICYKNVLAVALKEEFCEKKKSIILPRIGAVAYFPKEKIPGIAVFEILTFIKDNPKAYSYINLMVKDRVEFDLCTALFDYYSENPLEKIYSL